MTISNLTNHKKYLLCVILAVLFLCGAGRCERLSADPLPELSDSRFDRELSQMTAEYDKDVTLQQARRDPYISERLILKSEDTNLDPDDYGAVDAIQDRDGTYILQFDSPGDAREAARSLEAEEETLYVEPDTYLFSCALDPEIDETRWGESCPVIGADRYAEAVSGISRSLTIAVLDTGVSFTSPKLSGRLDQVHARSFVSGQEVDQSQRDSSDRESSHGTHVAGIIVQCTEALDNIRILPLRVLNDEGKGTVSQSVSAMRYAVEQGAEVINLSLCGPSEGSTALRNAIDEAVAKGVCVVTVAGNNNRNVSGYIPSQYEECIVAGSVDGHSSSYERAASSNYGSTLDVMAPGVSVYSTVILNQENGYDTRSGTSMASPHVAAAAAMIKLSHSGYSASAVEHVLQSNVRDLGDPGKDDYYGYGLLDLTMLLEQEEDLDDDVNAWEEENAQAAERVMELIRNLPSEITLEEKEQVEEARAAYEALTFAQKSLVTNLDDLTSAEETIRQLEIEEQDRQAAAQVEEIIRSLPASGEMTLEDEEAVRGAREAYDALTTAQKTYVTNLDHLERAEEAIRQLKKEVQDREAASQVEEMIRSLPAPGEMTLEDEEAVRAAREAYEALTTDQKAYVTNLDDLERAEETILQLEKEVQDREAASQVEEMIRSLPASEEMTLGDGDAVRGAREAYEALTTDQKAYVTNLDDLESAEERIRELEEDEQKESESESESESETESAPGKEDGQESGRETDPASSQGAEYGSSNPRPNVTYRVPLKRKQKTKLLRVTGLRDGDRVVSWKSSNPKKAVAAGNPDGTCRITAGKKTGKVRITAVCASGRKVVFRLRIQKNKVRTKKIRTAKKTLRLEAGTALQLETSLYPITSRQKRKYRSTDKSVVKVTKTGMIRAVSPGSAKIVVSSGSAKLKIRILVTE